jgi:SAM-dependent methyltransferase
MNDPVLQSQIDGAEAYERLMVPALFAPWTDSVCRAAEVTQGERVLDLACGTGVLARAAWRHMDEHGRVTGLDPNLGMLEVARRLRPELDWREGAAESLPFPYDSFDAVVSQFGLMFFRDRRQSLQEMVRVLRPGGTFAIAVWDSLVRNPAYATEVSVVRAIAGNRAADPIAAPFQLGAVNGLRSVFAEGGIHSVEIVTVQETGRFPSLEAMVEADLRGWLPVVGVILSEEEIHEVVAECRKQLASYVQPDEAVVVPMSAHIAFGRVN